MPSELPFWPHTLGEAMSISTHSTSSTSSSSLSTDNPDISDPITTDFDAHGHHYSHNDRILTFDLNAHSTDKIIDAAKRTTTLNLRPDRKYEPKNVEIIASTLYSGGDEDGTVRVITASTPRKSTKQDLSARQRWM